ncbi:4-hydroxy-tetrahydrodipicolinate synthase [Tepidibacillus infernus]|uniref:4-hydroxy-tetrahydrodipicolinate synthase n=1 Tax=Tepidibacillus TaxID=1494427 RepID=UPI000856ED33|nr:4-hydroxy-tetrahydrodipicolinate synthase [Tepidibacillus sp. HK-1]GBF11298.1 4-hydroxy-tetrahydrodipicolinate synthase [Tepidibacillus sp. HK-1]
MDFGRLITAMVTPFNQKLEIDLEKTKNLVNHLINTGTETIVVAGTTGESPTLTKNEKLLLFEKVIEFADGRAKVIAGTGTNDTKSSIELTKQAEEIGVDGVMLVAPYYNKPSQEGLYQHFKSIAEETALPIMIYNIPGRTGINIQAKTMVQLASISNIVAVKEASGDLTQMAEIIANVPSDFYLYSGDDKLTLPVLAIGGHGIVSVASHVVGNEMKEMIDHYFKGNVKEAALEHLRLLPLFEAIFITSNPAPIKALLEEIGIKAGSVRLPLVSVTREQIQFVTNIYNRTKTIS